MISIATSERSSRFETFTPWAHFWTVCIREQRPPQRTGTVVVMRPEHLKIAIAGAWLLGLAALAFLVNLSSIGGWTLLLGLGLLPPFILMRMWRQPAQTMSERIREGLR